MPLLSMFLLQNLGNFRLPLSVNVSACYKLCICNIYEYEISCNCFLQAVQFCQAFFGLLFEFFFQLFPCIVIVYIHICSLHSVSLVSSIFVSIQLMSLEYLICDVPHRRRLRSASTEQLDVPTCRRSTVGGHAFPVAGAKVWNSLPSDVMSASSLSVF